MSGIAHYFIAERHAQAEIAQYVKKIAAVIFQRSKRELVLIAERASTVSELQPVVSLKYLPTSSVA